MNEDIEYEVFSNKGRSQGFVHGMQIGRFAVRNVWPLCWSSEHPERCYVVDHMPTGMNLMFKPITFEEAVRFADDVSRFSEQDPTGTDIGELMPQLGRRMIHWISETRAKMYDGEPWPDYREFYATFKGFPDEIN